MLADSIIEAMVATNRPEAAKTFYRDVLGLTLVSEDAFTLKFAGAIGFLRVAKAPGAVPSAHAVLAFVVPDAAATARALAAKGVRMERFGFLPHDEAGLWTSPDGAKVGWFRDPDLNLLSIVQNP